MEIGSSALKMASVLLGSLRRSVAAASWGRAGIVRCSSASVGQKEGIVRTDETPKSVETVAPDELVRMWRCTCNSF